MKVKDLIKELKTYNQEAEIILQKDAEGNGYSPLAGGDNQCVYIPDSTWSGEVHSLLDSADENCMKEDEWQEIKKKGACVVLYPVN